MSEYTSDMTLKNRIRSLESELAAIKAGVRSVLNTNGFKSAAQSIFRLCKDLVGATSGYVALLPENELIFLDTGENSCNVDPFIPMPIRGMRDKACREAKVVYENNLSAGKWPRRLPEGHIPLTNIMFVPLVIDGKVVGVIGLANKKADFTDEDAVLATVFGEFAALALRNAEIEEKHRRDEKSLIENEEKFRLTFRTSPDAININRVSDGKYIDINEGFTKLTGYGREIIGRSSIEICIWDDPNDRIRLISRLNRDGCVENLEARFRLKDGRIRTGLMSARVLRINHEEVILTITRDITERKQAEMALRESEEWFRSIFEGSRDAILIAGEDGRFLRVNKAAAGLTGYSVDELHGMSMHDLHDGTKPIDCEAIICEVAIRKKDGSTVDVESSKKKILINGIPAMLINARDVSERKRAERKLRESETKYRQIVDHSPSGIFEVDVETRKFIRVNGIICTYTGYTEKELLSMNLFDLMADESKPVVAEQFRKITSGETLPATMEYKVRIKGGESRWVYATMKSFSKNSRLEAVIQDITERKRMEEKLRFTARKLSLATGAVEMGIWHWNMENDILFWDKRMYRLHDIRPEEFENAQECWKRFIHPEDLAAVLSAIKDTIKKRKNHIQFRTVWPDGQIRVLECHVVLLSDPHGKPMHMIGVNRDITDRKKEEKDLRLQKELLQTILDNIPLIIVFFDSDCRIRWVNRTWEEKLGWSFAESREIDVLGELYPDQEDRRKVLGFINRAEGAWNDSKTRVRDGSFINTRWTNVTLSDGTIIGIGEDISDRKREEQERRELKEQLLHAQKMEAIGTLAGGIAHDFNNLLFPIMGYAEMLKDDLPPASPLQDNLKEILTAGNRATKLVRQILTFSCQKDDEIQPIEIEFIIGEAVKLSRSTLPTTIGIVQEIAPGCGFVLADPTQIHQLAMNLITNAYHAMLNTGGVLTISLKPVILTGKDRKAKGLKSGSYLRLTVKDTGMGMDPATLERIFEPYFTTKPIDKGTGLGLPVVHGIVKNLQGEIFVESKLGEGTTFDVYLPKLESLSEECGLIEAKPFDAAILSGNERILLVDDEAPILKMEKRMLEKLGYRVETRQSSLEALEAFRADPGAWDLVITDMTMPHMTGDLLAKTLMEIREDIPVVLCTGFSEKIDAEAAAAMGIAGFLMKPIVRTQMLDTIRKALYKN